MHFSPASGCPWGVRMKLCLYKVGEGEWVNHASKVRESEHLEESQFWFFFFFKCCFIIKLSKQLKLRFNNLLGMVAHTFDPSAGQGLLS